MLWIKSHIIRTRSITEVAAWYAQVFQQEPYFTNESYIWFEIAGYEFGVFQADILALQNHSINIYWGVEDIESEYQRILELWAKSLSKPVSVWGGIMMADLEDPFWNFFGIISHGD